MHPNDTTQEIPYGYCQCGCGQETGTYTRTRQKSKTNNACVEGESRPFVKNHGKRSDPVLRFWAKVDKRGPNDCWLWTGAHGEWGGRFSVNGKPVPPSRFAYELENEPIPQDMYACHHCDNPLCCNPKHIFAGTPHDNAQDMVNKGRHVAQRNPEKLSRGKRHSDALIGHMPRGEARSHTKLTESQVREIFDLDAQGWTQPAIANHFSVTRSAIQQILIGNNWKHLGLTRQRHLKEPQQ